jgi:hypothetical protein
MLFTDSATPVLLPITISSSSIFVTELSNNRGLIKGAGVILILPPIIILALINKIGWASNVGGKDVRSD